MGDHDYITNLSADELVAGLAAPVAEPGSPVHEAYRAALELRIAEMHLQAAQDSLAWAKVAALSTVGATVIALVALLVALF